MASNKRILNIDRNCFYDRGVIALGMNNCAIIWVIKGETVRDTTVEERIALRAEQAQQEKRREPLMNAEIPGLKFEGPLPQRHDLIRAAHEFMRAFEPCLKAAKTYSSSCF